jgi:hypothetical protein
MGFVSDPKKGWAARLVNLKREEKNPQFLLG